jgi:site-specific DNA recombinase
MMISMTTKKMPLRAVGYCRTSGEGQRDNTSIPNQKQDIESTMKQEGWRHLQHYVDESKTGSKIAGREDFQRMMKDAANDMFDVVVVSDISRFGRDGYDIIDSARTLKSAFGVDLVDTKGQYDTRDHRRVLGNFMFAGVAQDERFRIMERTARGRIRRAEEGLPWTSHPPIGREYDKEKKVWYVTDKGKTLANMIAQYLDGRGTSSLAREFGINPAMFSAYIHKGQLAGVYTAHFHYPEINIKRDVDVPGMPEIVSAAVLEQAKKRLVFNRRNNRTDVRRYYLTGFLRCAECGKVLTGTRPHRTYTQYYHHGVNCKTKTVPGKQLEAAILDYLYKEFLDQPAFDVAARRALPSVNDRNALDKEVADTQNRLDQNQRKIGRLVDAIANGADVGLLLEKQDALKAERQTLEQRRTELLAKAAALPDVEQVQRAAELTRLRLVMEHKGKDWRQLPFEDIRKFLLHLFSETSLTSGKGMFISKNDEGELTVTFKGQVDFRHLLVSGKPLTEAFARVAARWKAEIGNEFRKAVKAANERLTATHQGLDREYGPLTLDLAP